MSLVYVGIILSIIILAYAFSTYKRKMSDVRQLTSGVRIPVAESSTVITGDDSSMPAVSPGNLPVGQDVEAEGRDIHDPDTVLAPANLCVY